MIVINLQTRLPLRDADLVAVLTDILCVTKETSQISSPFIAMPTRNVELQWTRCALL